MRPEAIELPAIGGETIRVASHGHEAVSLIIGHERFGVIARVRLGPDEAAALGAALGGHVEGSDTPDDVSPWRA